MSAARHLIFACAVAPLVSGCAAVAVATTAVSAGVTVVSVGMTVGSAAVGAGTAVAKGIGHVGGAMISDDDD
jgi:hypothetical protein